jgi:enamine deaminase RidA (YjgF/YER057c/UK114 family)
MNHELINPPELGPPRGYSNGILAAPGRLLFVAGQIGCDAEFQVVSDDFVAQFERALENVLCVVRTAGGVPEDIVRFTIFVVDKDAYLGALGDVGVAYRRHMGRHYPAMALVEVRALIEPRALLEIEATAVIA